MEKDDKGSTMIRVGVSGRMFLLVPAYPGCPGSKAVKRSLLLLVVVRPGSPRQRAVKWLCVCGGSRYHRPLMNNTEHVVV